MGHGGVAKGWWGTHRPTGMTVVVLVSALVFLSVSAGLASASHHHICSTDKSSIKLMTYETAFFTSSDRKVKLRVESAGCINDTHVFHLSGLKVSNQTSQVKKIRRSEFSFINCGNYVVKIGPKIVKLKHFSDVCLHKPITVSVESPALLGKKCSQSGRGKEEVEIPEKGKAACRDTGRRHITKPASNIEKMLSLFDANKKSGASDLFFDTSLPDGDKDIGKRRFDTPDLFFGGQQEPKEVKMPSVAKGFPDDIFVKSPSFNYEDLMPVMPSTKPSINLNEDFFENETYSKRRNYKENAIPIFIGIVAFTVSMCLRFCLCRGKNVVRRVTTVTVIRSQPANSADVPQDHQDPPPAYVDVVNENIPPDTSNDDACVEPPPPAYADIAHEVLPPTYSEVEAQSMSSEAAPLADQETTTQTSSSPPDPGSDPDGKSAESSRGVLSKYISQQKQFAFKVLEEDE